jgi:hypothetical protein
LTIDKYACFFSKFFMVHLYFIKIGFPCFARRDKAENGVILLHGHPADSKFSGEMAVVSKFFVHKFWPDLQHWGVKDLTRAALNPDPYSEADMRLHK